ncbi:MAG: AmmeMemoRadiSam system protein A [Bacteroidales bacterium]
MDFQDIILDDKDKQNLLNISRQTLELFVKKHSRYQVPPSLITPNLQQKAGAFVTLRKKDKLRGCIGTFQPQHPLYLTIRDLTISSAAYDHRFTPVEEHELPDIEIEISILTPLQKIHNIEEIELGKDGILLKKGIFSGTFLPQVATQMQWTKEEFLGHCARDKAGIGWEGWKDAEIYTFRTIVFDESLFR